MDNTKTQTMNENESLLVLNDYCLMEIFQRLTFVDYTNLAYTCRRLRDVARYFNSPNHKKIKIGVTSKQDKVDNMSEQELSKMLSVIGDHVSEVEVYYGHIPVRLKLIQQKCKNLKSISLFGDNVPQSLEHFQNLKRLKVNIDNDISINQWKNIIASNPALEELYFYGDGDYEDGLMALLTQLPKLQSLGLPLIPPSFHQKPDFQQFLQLSGLTKLSLRSYYNLNGILVDVAKSMNLVKLYIRMKFDGESIGIIKSFQNLKVLSIHHWEDWNNDWFSNATDFPPRLQRLKIEDSEISCRYFLKVLQHLELLKEFDLDYGQILWDDSSKLIYPNCVM